MIFGLYNVPGYPDPRILPWTERSLREIFALVLTALNKVPNITLRPADEKIRPWVDWSSGIEPVRALACLCEMYEYQAAYNAKADQIFVEPREPDHV